MASSLMSQDWSSSRLKLGSIASSVSQGGNPARVGSQNTVTVDVNKGMPIDFDYSHVETERDPSQWTASVTPKRDVVYGAALSAQMNMIRSLGLTQVDLDDKFVLQFSKLKQARIANMQFEGGAFRKVRMTYFDAGPNVQVSFKFIGLRATFTTILVSVILTYYPPFLSPIQFNRCSMLCGCLDMNMMCLCWGSISFRWVSLGCLVL